MLCYDYDMEYCETSGDHSKHKTFCTTFVQCWTNVEDDGPTLYTYYTNVLCLLGYSDSHMILQAILLLLNIHDIQLLYILAIDSDLKGHG